MASGGGLEFKGGGTGFEGIGVDDRALMKQLEALRKQVADKKVQVRIHRRGKRSGYAVADSRPLILNLEHFADPFAFGR